MPILFVVQRGFTGRLRKRRDSLSPPRDNPPVISSLSEEPCVGETQRNGVVRISCSITPSDAELLKNIRGQILRATGSPCSTSEIVRASLVAFYDLSLDEALISIQKLAKQKSGPRPKIR
jgi:hypothetical protein